MPISEDLRSVSTALAHAVRTPSSEHSSLICLACANLIALAEQVEALEAVPLSVEAVFPAPRPVSGMSGNYKKSVSFFDRSRVFHSSAQA